MFLVSGASANHGKSLVQFVRSARRCEPLTPLVIYDLGLNEVHLEALSDLDVFPERFPFEEYPPHLDVNVAAGHYAWKPAIILREFEKRQDSVCWMDAGNVIRLPLLTLRWELLVRGFYSAESEGPLERWTHPGVFDALGLPRTFAAGKGNLNGACVAFSWRKPQSRNLLRSWFEAAMNVDVIAPPGSSRMNHRQDQALLTVLAYRDNVIKGPSKATRTFVTHQDVPE